MLLWWLGMASLAGWAAATCPQHCSCFTDPDGYESANCSVLALGQNTRSSLEMLAFQPRLGGYPTELAPRAFLPFSRAKFLWMVNCSVLGLPRDVFHGLTYVIRLDLSYNKIRKLNGAVFKPMESLTTLKLRSNPLELTPWDLIVSDSLQELDLGHCGLRTLPIGAFAGIPRLSRLYLDGNELRTLTYNTFPPTLRYINLARNRISDVNTEIFTSMRLLRKIDLSKNPINCTCNLLILQDWFSGQGVIFDNGVTCIEPSQYKGMRLSKINEDEMCTLEEVKRHRRINDIQSYRDSKPHRTHNMIRDPDFQSDQPNHNYAEVLFHDDGLTHMEMSNKHFSLIPTDLSDENNKVAESKQELHSTKLEIAAPTKVVTTEGKEEESSKEEENILHEATHDEDLFKASTTTYDESVKKENMTEVFTPSTSPEIATESSNIFHSTIDFAENNIPDNKNLSKSMHEEFADEGYSLVPNLPDIMMSDGEGSGDNESIPTSISTEDEDKTNFTSTTETFTFPSSLSDAADYNYDTHHDYSAEVTGSTTEAMSTIVEEGSGEAENETISYSSVPPIWREEEENVTTEHFIIIENSTESWSSSSEISSSSESSIFLSISDEPTEENSTETSSSSTSEESTPSLVSAITIGFSSEEPTTPSQPSSSESTMTTPVTSPVIFDSSTEKVSTSSLPFPLEISTEAEEVTTEREAEIVSSGVASEEPRGRLSVGRKEEGVDPQYLVAGSLALLVVLVVLAVVVAYLCRRKHRKVRLEPEAAPGTELQDMLLPAENGVRLLPQNGKEVDEKQRLSSDWDDKPIETVTARLTVLAAPQTPVFIHKSLA